MTNCPLQLNISNFWQCPNCGWVYKKKSDKPPQRNCPITLNPEQIIEQEKIQQKQKYGVGTELKRILQAMLITPASGCGCDNQALLMNAEGPDWCEENIDTIVGWMKENASKRKLKWIFTEVAAKVLIRQAIKNTRKKLEILERTETIEQ